MILYHRSKHKWEWPDYNLIQTLAQGWGSELGLYTCNVDNLYGNSGKYLYTIHLKKDIRPRAISVTELRQIRDLSVYREILMEQGWKVLQVMEESGKPTIFIIMDMDAIEEIYREEK